MLIECMESNRIISDEEKLIVSFLVEKANYAFQCMLCALLLRFSLDRAKNQELYSNKMVGQNIGIRSQMDIDGYYCCDGYIGDSWVYSSTDNSSKYDGLAFFDDGTYINFESYKEYILYLLVYHGERLLSGFPMIYGETKKTDGGQPPQN